MYKVGEIVEIIKNFNAHGFEIGQHVRIFELDDDGTVDSAVSLDDGELWYIGEDEIIKIEN